VFAYLHLLSGGLILGAFYMATDMVTTPLTKTGQLIVGVGTGILTALIRLYGGYPEGVMFAILLMELVVPLIDRYSRPNIYGWETKNER
jgi:electron transport complex protein RnfD